jgi:hypothetical protein
MTPVSGAATALAAGALCLACSASDPLSDCAEGPARPLEVGTVVETLKAHGFTARSERRQCATGTVANVMNSGGDEEEFKESNERVRREGHVICLVQEQPYPNAALQGYDDRDKVGWSVGNVDCAVYFTSEGKDEQVSRLEAAMRELAQMHSI